MEISTNGDIHTEIYLQMWICRYLQMEISKISTNEDISKWRYPQIDEAYTKCTKCTVKKVYKVYDEAYTKCTKFTVEKVYKVYGGKSVQSVQSVR